MKLSELRSWLTFQRHRYLLLSRFHRKWQFRVPYCGLREALPRSCYMNHRHRTFRYHSEIYPMPCLQALLFHQSGQHSSYPWLTKVLQGHEVRLFFRCKVLRIWEHLPKRQLSYYKENPHNPYAPLLCGHWLRLCHGYSQFSRCLQPLFRRFLPCDRRTLWQSRLQFRSVCYTRSSCKCCWRYRQYRLLKRQALHRQGLCC